MTVVNTYDFNTQLIKGESKEGVLDTFYSRLFHVRKVDMSMQRIGIDRLFVSRRNGSVYSVEYKADGRTSETGNVFIETVSVDVSNKLGWAYTSCAQVLLYFVPQNGVVYRTTMMNVRMHLADWLGMFDMRPIKNNGYYTKGIVVPVEEFIKICAIDNMKQRQNLW